ncbi:GPI mannosyltransferase 2 [Euwallacea fornicatus]|uniref:GPI mannosyltransferase 2 n=1 Tax=Euwallacea fornicatus TaxID=995702 RepID=UPI00338F9A9C
MAPTRVTGSSVSQRYEKEIAHTAYVSRVFLIVLQCATNLLIPDHNAQAFVYVAERNNTTLIDKSISTLLGGFVRWDAHYFMHIAKYGYTYEHSLAFFPFYPFLGSIIAKTLAPFLYFMSTDSLLLVSFIAINTFIFKQTSLVLFRLTLLFFNEETAYVAVRIFCFNPASVFFSAPYTETVFSFLSFTGMHNSVMWYKGKENLIAVLLPFLLSATTRSNGVLNAGFIVFLNICLALKGNFKVKVYYVFKIVASIMTCLSGFVYFIVYSRKLFCTGLINIPISRDLQLQAQMEHYVLPYAWTNQSRPWCNSLELPYTYVQSHYWNVGFLKYFQLKQTPNFLLALPILYIVISSCIEHFYINFLKRRNLKVFAFEVFCLLFVNVQISTRMLCSASPVFYWICAFRACKSQVFRKVIWFYILGYFIVGTVMFCNFLPWT